MISSDRILYFLKLFYLKVFSYRYLTFLSINIRYYPYYLINQLLHTSTTILARFFCLSIDLSIGRATLKTYSVTSNFRSFVQIMLGAREEGDPVQAFSDRLH